MKILICNAENVTSNMLSRLGKVKTAASAYLKRFTDNDLAVIMDGIEEAIDTVTPRNAKTNLPEFDIPMIEHLKHSGYMIERYVQQERQGKIGLAHIYATFAYFEADRGIALLEEAGLCGDQMTGTVYAEASQAGIDAFESLSFIETAKIKRSSLMNKMVRPSISSMGGIAKDANQNSEDRAFVVDEYEALLRSGLESVQVELERGNKRLIKIRKKNGSINYTGCKEYIYYTLVEKRLYAGKPRLIPQKSQFVGDTLKRHDKLITEAERAANLLAKFAEEDRNDPPSQWWPVDKAA